MKRKKISKNSFNSSLILLPTSQERQTDRYTHTHSSEYSIINCSSYPCMRSHNLVCGVMKNLATIKEFWTGKDHSTMCSKIVGGSGRAHVLSRRPVPAASFCTHTLYTAHGVVTQLRQLLPVPPRLWFKVIVCYKLSHFYCAYKGITGNKGFDTFLLLFLSMKISKESIFGQYC